MDMVYWRWANPQRMNDRYYLRRIYNFETPVERERYNRTLAAVLRQRAIDTWGDVFEVGCAEGIFTLELAPRCRSVTACDVSSVACRRAAERCRQYSNVRIEHLDVVQGTISGLYDLVFAMDVLDCIHGRGRINRVVANLADAVRPGGLLIISVCYLPSDWWARWLVENGDNLISFVQKRWDLRLIHQQQYPDPSHRIPGYLDHVIALFEKVESSDAIRCEL